MYLLFSHAWLRNMHCSVPFQSKDSLQEVQVRPQEQTEDCNNDCVFMNALSAV
jgi:hypothetical protein